MAILNVNDYKDVSGLNCNIEEFFENLNCFVSNQSLRRYQESIAADGRFEISDPRSAELVVCCGSLYAYPKSFLYKFNSKSGDFWLFTKPVSDAYAIGAIYFEDIDVCINGITHFSAHDLQARIDAARGLKGVDFPEAPPRLVIGHGNFAHFAWNELSALLDLSERQAIDAIDALVVFEPIAPIEAVLDFEFRALTHSSERDLSRKNVGTELRPNVMFCPGSIMVTTKAQQAIRSACISKRINLPTVSGDYEFTVWLSLRHLYRRPVNEEQVMTSLIARILNRFARARIFLDGYSVGDDLYAPGRYDTERELGRRDEVRATVARIMSNIDATLHDRIADLTEFSLPQSIDAARLVDFYVCHHGTQQHKIGWFYACPGVIHVGPSTLRSMPAGWVKAQAEDSILPDYIPLAVVDESHSGNQRQDNPFFADYVISDPEGFIGFILDKLSVAYERRESVAAQTGGSPL